MARLLTVISIAAAYAAFSAQATGPSDLNAIGAPTRRDDMRDADTPPVMRSELSRPSVGAPGDDPGTKGAQPVRPVADVRDFGAVGDGVTDDSDAIQRANDHVARRGGGEVRFGAGTYVASGIRQDSFVTLVGEGERSVIKHPDGLSPEQIIRTRAIRTTGTIERGSRTLRVEDASRIRQGALVAVRGAGGPSRNQISESSLAIGASDQTIGLRDVEGFSDGSTYRPNYVLLGDEIVSYASSVGGQLVGVKRGLYGTSAVPHRPGTSVAQLLVRYAVVDAVEGDLVTLDAPAAFGVRDAKVYVGSIRMQIRDLTLDGNRQGGGMAEQNPFPVLYELARYALITNTTIRNGDDGAIQFSNGTRDSVIEGNTLTDNGSLSRKGGAAVWLYHGSDRNVVRNNVIGGRSVSGIFVDDRTVASTEFDASSSRNLIEDNDIVIDRIGSSCGIGIFGSSNNMVRSNRFVGTTYGIRIYTGGQGTVPPPTSDNLVSGNSMVGHRYGIWVDGSDNRFMRNLLSDNITPIFDGGTQNEFD